MTAGNASNAEWNDHEITHLVMEAISQDGRVPVSKVRVSVQGSDIMLTGRVDCIGEKRAAEEDAKRVPGVSQILNFIAVQPEQLPEDEDLVVNVMQALDDDERIPAGHFEATSKDRIVTLRGEAITEIEKRAALDDARLTYGTLDVVDEVIILPQETSSDHLIEQQVTEELSRAPGLDENRIHAHVEDRVVHLRGSVDFPQQIDEAARIARDVPGVREVECELVLARIA